MLRITVHDEPQALTFQLEGRLAGPWLRELERCWQSTLADQRKRILRVNLTGVTFIDDAGKSRLWAMYRAGAEFVAADCMQTMTQLGLPLGSIDLTPNQALEEFRRLDKEGNFEQIAKDLVPKAPFVLQAKVGLEQARHDLELAELNLRDCDIVSEIDGVVVGRNVNPGNTVQAGQALMAVRSLTAIWIDANFKETQLADLRIGQRVRCEVDMYGSRHEFEGRITGFTMGTGQTLSLLPAQNATGNFVKIVQRLPVRVELTDYDPDKAPLFVGLSVEPFVYYKEPPTGPHAGEILQPLAALPTRTTDARP